jgi:glycosyltransferase involved in cell wall biosynthesis
MEKATAYVVPLRIGGGTRLKIYEAMAMEKPIVSTTIGAEGLPVADGEHLLLADTPEAFAARCVEVLKGETAAHELGSRAAKLVREQFGWDKVAASFAELCQRAIRLHQPESSEAQVEEELPTAV